MKKIALLVCAIVALFVLVGCGGKASFVGEYVSVFNGEPDTRLNKDGTAMAYATEYSSEEEGKWELSGKTLTTTWEDDWVNEYEIFENAGNTYLYMPEYMYTGSDIPATGLFNGIVEYTSDYSTTTFEFFEDGTFTRDVDILDEAQDGSQMEGTYTHDGVVLNIVYDDGTERGYLIVGNAITDSAMVKAK